MKTILTATALTVVLATGALAAEELAAQAQRIWAPAGDIISLEQDHATASLLINDDHGDEAKLAEDWSLRGKTLGYGLFNYSHVSDSSHLLNVRGDGGNVEGSGLAGNIGLWSQSPGKYKASLSYQKHDLYYDRDVELRNPGFPSPPPPPELPATPHLEWKRGRLDLGWRLSSAASVVFGVADMRREGNKSSLRRGFFQAGTTPPNVLGQDTKQYEISLGGTLRTGKLGSQLHLALRSHEGPRELEDVHTWDDERKTYRGSLDLAYDLSARTRVAAHGSLSRLELEGAETWGSGAGSTDSDVENQVGLLAFKSRLGRSTAITASARFEGQQSEATIGDDAGILQASDRDRTRQDYRLSVGNTSLPHTRLRLQYRYTNGDLDGMVSAGGRPGESTVTMTQDLTEKLARHNLDLRADTRLTRAIKLRLGLRWDDLDVEQSASGDPWYEVLGDHQRSRLNWTLALKTRLHRKLPVDFGYQGVDQSFERTEGETAETTWQANRLFLNVNWLAGSRLSVYGMVHYGLEVYELTGVGDPAGGHAAYDYHGRTWRFVPGANFQLTSDLSLEGMWEGIRYEDTGSETPSLAPVERDDDRYLVRARWQATETIAAVAGYRRGESFENRWDNYITDLWSLSVSGVF